MKTFLKFSLLTCLFSAFTIWNAYTQIVPPPPTHQEVEDSLPGADDADPDLEDHTEKNFNIQFPGGMKELEKFLNNNLQYPLAQKSKKMGGDLKISFGITKTGKVWEPYIVQKIGKGFDEEAIRLIKMMPDWIPARTPGGEPLGMMTQLTLRFIPESKTIALVL